jgi:hypothetical protein
MPLLQVAIPLIILASSNDEFVTSKGQNISDQRKRICNIENAVVLIQLQPGQLAGGIPMAD